MEFRILGCYQSVKDKNFESNSQLREAGLNPDLRCYQSVKDKNFESNSQPVLLILMQRICCYQSVKDKNFESNSQPGQNADSDTVCCYQSVKDKNFESNSQLSEIVHPSISVVISLSKIKISKAIHNYGERVYGDEDVVISICFSQE